MWTDFRLKLRHFLKKNAKIIFIVVSIWAIVFFINLFLKNYKAPVKLQTTYDPHTSVMDSGSSVPKKVSNNVEEMLEKYVSYCLEGNVESAYEMLSDTCKEYSFNNDIDDFTAYIVNKIGSAKRYAIQDYSNSGNTYIYQIKYSEDMLATGLTNTTYQYTEEKIIFKKQRNGELEMSVGNFIDYEDVQNISENEYLKVDVRKVEKYYSVERYTVVFTNRSDYTIVIADQQGENEIFLELNSKDIRTPTTLNNIVLKPNQNITLKLEFAKFYDNDNEAANLTFGSVRVMEQYSGTEVDENVIQSEIQNAVAKFSVNIPITYQK